MYCRGKIGNAGRAAGLINVLNHSLKCRAVWFAVILAMYCLGGLSNRCLSQDRDAFVPVGSGVRPQSTPRDNGSPGAVDSAASLEDSTRSELSELRSRLESQERELQELRRSVTTAESANAREPIAAPQSNSEPVAFYNLLSAPEEPGGGAQIRVKSSAPDIGLMVYGRIAIDSIASDGRLLAPFGYIFLGPRFEESQWTNTISARQSTLGFLFSDQILVITKLLLVSKRIFFPQLPMRTYTGWLSIFFMRS